MTIESQSDPTQHMHLLPPNSTCYFERNQKCKNFSEFPVYPTSTLFIILTLFMLMSSADNRSEFSNLFFKNFQNSNFQCHIWIQHEKCIKTSTNKPSIGAVVLEIVPLISSCKNSFKFQFWLTQICSQYIKQHNFRSVHFGQMFLIVKCFIRDDFLNCELLMGFWWKFRTFNSILYYSESL